MIRLVVFYLVGFLIGTSICQAKERSRAEEYQESCRGEVATLIMGRELGLDYKKVRKLAEVRCGYTQEEWDKRKWKGVDNVYFQGCIDASLIVANAEGLEGEKMKKRSEEIWTKRCGWILEKKSKDKKS